LRTRAIPERFCGGDSLRRGAISSVCTFTFYLSVCILTVVSMLSAELQEAFMLFDYGKNGTISARDIGPVVRSVGLKPSQAEIQSIMADVQQSGLLTLLLLPN